MRILFWKPKKHTLNLITHIKRNIFKGLFILSMISLVSNNFFAQKTSSDTEFDSVFFNVATKVASTDFQRALYLSDSLYKNNEDPIRKLKAIMLNSSLYQQNRNLNKSISKAEEALQIAIKAKNYVWQSRIYGSLSTQYRILKLYDTGWANLTKAEQIAKKVDIPQERITFQAILLQEKAYYDLEYKNYKKAADHYLMAEKLFLKIQNERNRTYFIASNQEFLARTYLLLKDYKQAKKYYNQVLEYVSSEKNRDVVFTAFVDYGLGVIAMHEHNMEESLNHLIQAKEISEQSKNTQLQSMIYEALAILYTKTGDLDKQEVFHEKQLIVNDAIEADRNQLIRNYVNEKDNQNELLKSTNNYLLIGVVLGFLMFVSIAFFYVRKQKRQRIKFLKIYNEVKQNKFIVTRNNQKAEEEVGESGLTEENKKKGVDFGMSNEMKNEILIGLEKYKQSTSFLKSDANLSQLSTSLKVNSKYISYILNNEFNMNVNSYINSLRINYILKKLNSDPKYLQYSISYLAEASGFSTHSKFSQVFKNVVGMNPSEYIKQLTQEKNS